MIPTSDDYQVEVIPWVDPNPPKSRPDPAEETASSHTWWEVLEMTLMFPVFACLFTVAACDFMTRPFRNRRPAPQPRARVVAPRAIQHPVREGQAANLKEV